jgi:predicted RNase H-related nuclease YkuK (DUF458 family)
MVEHTTDNRPTEVQFFLGVPISRVIVTVACWAHNPPVAFDSSTRNHQRRHTKMWNKAKEAIINSSADSSVYIGCDSIRYKRDKIWYAKYATVVVVHMESSKGCKIFYHQEVLRDFGSLKDRLLNEVNFAIQAATDVLDVLGDRPLEVHLDLNNDPKHKSNVAVKEAVGWVMGMGFVPVIKPDGWAATHAADHCARHKTFAA